MSLLTNLLKNPSFWAIFVGLILFTISLIVSLRVQRSNYKHPSNNKLKEKSCSACN